MRLKAAVIGLGNVGSLYDSGATPGCPRSHAGAYAAHPAVELIGGVDPNPERRATFEGQWDCPAYPTVDDLLARGVPDIWSVATPVADHYSTVLRAIDARAQAIWCEKPLASSSIEAGEMVRLAEHAAVPLAVNYLRRWDPRHQQLVTSVHEGALGMVQHAAVHYCRGLRNYGSHALDLLRWMLGEASWVSGVPSKDQESEDPSPAVLVGFPGGTTAALMPVERSAYEVFELDLLGTAGRLTLKSGGSTAVMYGTEVNGDWGELRLADGPKACFDDGLQGAMLSAVDNLVGALAGEQRLCCRGDDGLVALELVEAIERSVASGAVVNLGARVPG
jgi:predicted dehydrogenase